MKEDYEKLRETILIDRKQRNLTQREYAGLLGTSQTVISRIELGDVEDMTVGTAKGLCRALGKSMGDIFDNKVETISIEAANLRRAKKRLNDLTRYRQSLQRDLMERQFHIDEINREIAGIMAYLEEHKKMEA